MRYRGRLQQKLARCVVGGPIDFLMLQEHHLSERRIRQCGPILQRHSDVFWSASYGPSGTQGGVCISIGDSWRSAIVGRGIVVPGRAQWLLLQWGQQRLGMLNVYAPNHASARADFWSAIALGLPAADAWCVGGDFNMLERAEDRRGGSLSTILGAELAAWERLYLSLRLEDAWLHPCFARSQGSLAFLRSDKRVGGMNMSKIDGFYVSDMFGDCGDLDWFLPL